MDDLSSRLIAGKRHSSSAEDVPTSSDSHRDALQLAATCAGQRGNLCFAPGQGLSFKPAQVRQPALA